MKTILIIGAIAAFAVFVIIIIGYSLPVKHSASIDVALKAPPAIVWQKLLDFKKYPEWRKKLKSVEIQSDTSWIEIDQKNHQLPLVIILQEPLNEIVTKINSKELPFGGSWSFRLSKKDEYTIITITENGEIYNPIFRFVSRYIMGYSASVKQYAEDLESAFKSK